MPNRTKTKISLIFARYLFLALIALPGMQIFYSVFTPLTIYPVLWILSLFYPSMALIDSMFIINSIAINIIPACIAGAAYYLLLILNFTTPMDVKVRVKSLIFLIASFLLINIVRLVIFTALFINGYRYFDFVHLFVWYFGSTILVVLIWFINVYLFKIKGIPAYSDINYLLYELKKAKRKK